MSKVFSQAHYDADDNAKHDLIRWLEKQGFMAWVNDDQFGIDVQAIRNGEQFEFEVEVKHNWVGASFPFDAVHWSARKLKFAEDSRLNWFAMFNDDRSHALFASGAVLLSSPIVTKDTKYSAGERFVEVPLARCMFRRMKEER
jgi:hypothetical protein